MSFGQVIERRSNPKIVYRYRDVILDREGFEPPLRIIALNNLFFIGK